MEDRWLSVGEVSVFLGSPRILYINGLERDLPAHKIGRLWKFNKEDLDLWVKKQAKTIGNPKHILG